MSKALFVTTRTWKTTYSFNRLRNLPRRRFLWTTWVNKAKNPNIGAGKKPLLMLDKSDSSPPRRIMQHQSDPVGGRSIFQQVLDRFSVGVTTRLTDLGRRVGTRALDSGRNVLSWAQQSVRTRTNRMTLRLRQAVEARTNSVTVMVRDNLAKLQERVSGPFRDTSRALYWWALLAVGVYGFSTTLTRESFRYVTTISERDPSKDKK